MKRQITIAVKEEVYELLQVLTRGEYGLASVKAVIEELIDHAQQGIYRPGAWERDWLIHAFGDDFIDHLEPGDPYGRKNCEAIFQRPRKIPAETRIESRSEKSS
jgi:hypothetical protein